MDILYTVKSVTGALRRWVEANPELTGTLMKVAAIVAAVTVGLGTWLWRWLQCWGRWQSSVWDSLCWASKRYLPLWQQ